MVSTLAFQRLQGQAATLDERLDLHAAGRGLADAALDRGIDVERAFRRRARQAVGLIQHGHHQVAPILEDGVALGDEVLRAVQRRHRRRLADRRRVRRALRLHLGDGLDQRRRAAAIADLALLTRRGRVGPRCRKRGGHAAVFERAGWIHPLDL